MTDSYQVNQQKRILREDRRIAKQNERARRKARGERRVEVFVSRLEYAALQELKADFGITTSEAVNFLIESHARLSER